MILNFKIVTNIENIQKKYQQLWSISSKKTRLAIITLIVTGVIFFSYGLVERSATFSGFNMFLSIGFAFIIAAGMTIYSFIQQRKSYSQKVDKLIQDHRDFIYSYEITENWLSYSSSEIKMAFKWNRFSGYYYFGENLCLLVDDALSGPLIFNKQEMDATDYDELLKLIKQRLPQTELRNVS